MQLTTTVLVSNITNLSDARYCAGMGVPMLSFPLDSTLPSALSEERFQEIAGWVSGVELIGEFERIDVEAVNQLARKFALSSVVIPDELDERSEAGFEVPIIKRMCLLSGEPLQTLVERCEKLADGSRYLLLEDDSGLLKPEAMIEQLRAIAASTDILIGFGITKENVKEILNQIKPAGIALKGSNEIRPGYKEFDELAEILEQLDSEA